jgi:hypothetical protein
LCPDREKQTLLAESSVLWHRDYPKLEDCKWRIKIEDEKGYHEWNPLSLNQPVFTGAFDMISTTKPDKNSARLTRKSRHGTQSKEKMKDIYGERLVFEIAPPKPIFKKEL